MHMTSMISVFIIPKITKTSLKCNLYGQPGGWVWLRGTVSVLLSEERWFDSPGLHAKGTFGKTLNPILHLMCWSPPCVAATLQSCINACMN